MTLRPPFIISGRLLPAVRIGDVTISLEYSAIRITDDGRTRYRYYIDGGTWGECGGRSDLCSGVGQHGLQEGFESLLAFLGSPESGFGVAVEQWARENEDEIFMLQQVIEENPGLIVED